MKKSLTIAVMCCTALSGLMSTPALANPPIMPDLTGITDPQEACEAILKPNDPHSEFETEYVNLVPGGWTNDGEPVLDEKIGAAYGAGSSSWETIFLTSGFYRNGGSPNVWGGATATKHWTNTGQMWTTLQHQTRTSQFGCHVFKFVGPDKDPVDGTPDNLVEPPGLQSVGITLTEEQDIAGPNKEVLSDDDFYEYGQTVNALICISPNNVTKSKPGTWTGKNGFPASQCGAASTAAGGTVPSGNAPFI